MILNCTRGFSLAHPNEIMSKAQVDLLFDASSAVLFAVIESEYCMKGSPVMVPEWVMPTCEPSCPCQMDSELVQEAADFLLRMGMLQVSDDGCLRTSF